MFSYQFTSNSQNPNGDIVSTVVYSNGNMNITETYTNANASSQRATINSRLQSLQEAEDFVLANPSDSSPSSTPLE